MSKAPSIGRDLPDDVAFPLLRARLMSKRRLRQLPNVTGECWEWTGWCRRNGYGETSFRGKARPIHVLMYIITVGPLPEGKDIMHSCDNAPCFNPDHIAPGTRQQNLQDCVAHGRHHQASLTHCKRGHEFTRENTYTTKNGWRKCRICERAKQRMYEGWPPDIAYSAPKGYTGYIPAGLVRITPAPTKPRSNRTHCPRGHELVGDNLYLTKEGYRKCRPCKTAATMRFVRQIPVGSFPNPEAKP